MTSSGHQNLFTMAWNSAGRLFRKKDLTITLGNRVGGFAGEGRALGLPLSRRAEHLAILGKTGSGKTSLMRFLCAQDIAAGRGFAYFDLHGDTAPYLVALIAEEEQRTGLDLAGRLVLIDPSNRASSVGLNILESRDEMGAFVEIAETVEILKHRWRLDALGVRTEELLRHSLYVLSRAGLTLIDVPALLTQDDFRAACVALTPEGESRNYFEKRYNRLSEAMQTIYREAILNKISVYAADPHFRHLLGQTKSTLNLRTLAENGAWVIISLEKGRLGEEGATLGALLLAKLKHALLGRNSRRLFTLYCDEIQNLVAYDAALDVLLSEARKFGVAVVAANQYLEQYAPSMRAAMLAMGSHVFFALSGPDAERVAHAIGRGRETAQRLRNLPKRNFILREAGGSIDEGRVPTVAQPRVSAVKLLARVKRRWTRSRREVDAQILARQKQAVRERHDLGEEWD